MSKRSHVADRPAPDTIRLVLVEPRALYGAGVRDLLEREPDIVVVAEARSPAEVPDLVTSPPDVVVVDVERPDTGDVAASQRLRREVPEAALIIVGEARADDDLFRVVQAGAVAHVANDAQPSELLDAIRRVADGDEPIAETVAARPEVAQRIVGAFQELAAGGGPLEPLADPSPLTTRERQVLAHVGQGLTNLQIGASLGLREQTVKNHLSHAIGKLGARGRTQAVILAARSGWLSLDGPDPGASEDGAGDGPPA